VGGDDEVHHRVPAALALRAPSQDNAVVSWEENPMRLSIKADTARTLLMHTPRFDLEAERFEE
jgi:hypothetical protein